MDIRSALDLCTGGDQHFREKSPPRIIGGDAFGRNGFSPLALKGSRCIQFKSQEQA